MDYFRPYEGTKPYIFISYSHRNSEEVLPVTLKLRSGGYRVWYDEGIAAGTDWPLSVQQHLASCGAVLFFLSEHSLTSDNCFSEIKTAGDTGKRIVCVPLDSTARKYCAGSGEDSELLRPEWVSALSGAEFTDSPMAEFGEEFIGDYNYIPPPPPPTSARAVVFMVLCLLILGAAVYFSVRLFTGSYDSYFVPQATEAPVQAEEELPQAAELPEVPQIPRPIDIPYSVEKRAVALMLGTETGNTIMAEQVAGIKELYICGNMAKDSEPDIYFDENGVCFANDAKVQGNIDDTDFFRELVYLRKLVLAGENITDISGLGDLMLLRSLNVAGNPIRSLKGLKGFPSLEELDIRNTEIKDLSPLTGLPALKRVKVSRDMLPLELGLGRRYEVILAG